jgi:hypothetical protein
MRTFNVWTFEDVGRIMCRDHLDVVEASSPEDAALEYTRRRPKVLDVVVEDIVSGDVKSYEVRR